MPKYNGNITGAKNGVPGKAFNILVDVDGTLVNFLGQYAKYYRRETGEDVDYTKIQTYDISKIFKTNVEYKYLYYQSFYHDIDFMPGAKRAVNNLAKNHNIYFVTSSVTRESMAGKCRLLEHTFPWFRVWKHYINASRKSVINMPDSILIDDCPSQICEFNSLRICYGWPHNAHIKQKVDLWTSNWAEIERYIQTRPTSKVLSGQEA